MGMSYRGRTLRCDVEYDVKESPWTMGSTIHYDRNPQNILHITASEIGDEAFAGIASRTVKLRNNTVLPGAFTDCLMLECAEIEGDTSIAGGAFDDSILLVVEEIGNWFDSDYDFVLSGAGAE